MSTEIKNCPFCGSNMYHAIENHYWMCQTKGCFMNAHFVAESEAAAWNQRQPDTELIEALEGIVKLSGDVEQADFPIPQMKIQVIANGLIAKYKETGQ